jgi:hypothetical protein
MRRIYEFATVYEFVTVIAVLALSLIGFGFLVSYHGPLLIWFVFLMPLLWVFWLICVVLCPAGKAWWLAFLWMLIDLAVLGTLSLLMANVGSSHGSDGGDYLLVIAFSPLILPVIFASAVFPAIGNGIVVIVHKISSQLFSNQVGILSDWLGAPSSLLFHRFCFF